MLELKIVLMCSLRPWYRSDLYPTSSSDLVVLDRTESVCSRDNYIIELSVQRISHQTKSKYQFDGLHEQVIVEIFIQVQQHMHHHVLVAPYQYMQNRGFLPIEIHDGNQRLRWIIVAHNMLCSESLCAKMLKFNILGLNIEEAE